jgi:predicted ATPase
MISEVSIKNFKSLRDVRVKLERFTVFVGANGSGKTCVLEAIHSAVRAATGEPQKVFAHERHGDWVYTRGGVGDLSIRCVTPGGEFAVEATPPTGYPPLPEFLQKGRWEYRVTPTGPALATALESVAGLVSLRLDATALARPSYSGVDPPRMDAAGAGLASVLASMALTDPAGFDQLVEVARSLIPRLRRIRFREAIIRKIERELVQFGSRSVIPRRVRVCRGKAILLDFERAENISASAASEGTMLTLGLLTVLLGPTRSRVVLIDDLEHGLHPLAQEQLIDVIKNAQGQFPDLQVLATAHSPYLLNYVEPEQVRIVAAGADGYARCGLLTDHPKFSTWRNEFAPGEMWSVFGDKWVTETGAVV